MKNGLWVMALVFLMAAGCSCYIPQPETGYPPYGGDPEQYRREGMNTDRYMDMNFMYNYLAPYGNWVIMDPYGYVWVPRHMGYQWRPYCDGHWVMTDYGWTWIANEEWGAIPFHYGRWGYDDYIGWYWVPGTDWGPAWVSWRWSDQYTGWAPLQPGVEMRIGMDFASLSINIPYRFWVFLQALHFLDRDLNRYILPYERNATLIHYTPSHNYGYFRNNRIFNEGIGIDFVRRITRREVPQYRIRDVLQPGPARIVGNDLQVYRPDFRTDGTAKPQTFLNGEVARRELAPVKSFEPRQRAQMDGEASAVWRRQAEEQSLLEKTQTQELRDMQRKRDAELSQFRNSGEMTRIQQDHQKRMAELQNQHQVEKQQLTERHKQDAELVNQATERAKQEKKAPPVKKKKTGEF